MKTTVVSPYRLFSLSAKVLPPLGPMSLINLKVLTTVCIFFSFTGCISNQRLDGTTPAAPLVPVTNSTCDTIFASQVKDTDIKWVYKTVSSMQLKRDEFETTEAYLSRRRETLDSLLVKIKAKQGHEYVVFSTAIADSYARYDADLQNLEIGSQMPNSGGIAYFETKKLNYIIGPDWRVANIETGKLKREIYTGSNAFGVKANVLKEESDNYGVAFDEGARQFSSWPHEGARIKIKMYPEEARAVKGNIKVVIVGSLRSPYVSEFDEFVSPKLDHPMDITQHNKMLTVTTECAAIVNKATGRLVYRIK